MLTLSWHTKKPISQKLGKAVLCQLNITPLCQQLLRKGESDASSLTIAADYYITELIVTVNYKTLNLFYTVFWALWLHALHKQNIFRLNVHKKCVLLVQAFSCGSPSTLKLSLLFCSVTIRKVLRVVLSVLSWHFCMITRLKF